MQQASTHFSVSSPRPCVQLYAKKERMEYVQLARGRVQSPMGVICLLCGSSDSCLMFLP